MQLRIRDSVRLSVPRRVTLTAQVRTGPMALASWRCISKRNNYSQWQHSGCPGSDCARRLAALFGLQQCGAPLFADCRLAADVAGCSSAAPRCCGLQAIFFQRSYTVISMYFSICTCSQVGSKLYTDTEDRFLPCFYTPCARQNKRV